MNFCVKFLPIICFLAILSTSIASSIHGRVANGNNAEPHSAPYIVSIQTPTNKGYHHSCGGSIIDKNWILTAAHCLGDPEKSKLQIIKAGRHNINAKSEKFAQTRKIKYFKNHPKYPGGVIVAPFDIGLIYLSEPLEFNEAIQPVQLPKSGREHIGVATLFGWGLLETNKFPDFLQTADIPIISNQQCSKIYKDLIVPSNICTVDDVGHSSCSSDSGGPLVQINKDNKNIEQIGVVSYGAVPCGRPGGRSSSVFVRVSHFIEWIAEVKRDYESTL